MNDRVSNHDARKERYLDWAVFGLMDVLLTREGAPLRDIRIILEEAEHHPVDSSPMVFRLAGRDAARKILYPNHLDQNKSAPIAFTMGRPFHLF